MSSFGNNNKKPFDINAMKKASFYFNTCKYRDCEESFETLDELIAHVDAVHVDFSPENIRKLEKEKPEFLQMSLVLRDTINDETLGSLPTKNNTKDSTVTSKFKNIVTPELISPRYEKLNDGQKATTPDFYNNPIILPLSRKKNKQEKESDLISPWMRIPKSNKEINYPLDKIENDSQNCYRTNSMIPNSKFDSSIKSFDLKKNQNLKECSIPSTSSTSSISIPDLFLKQNDKKRASIQDFSNNKMTSTLLPPTRRNHQRKQLIATRNIRSKSDINKINYSFDVEANENQNYSETSSGVLKSKSLSNLESTKSPTNFENFMISSTPRIITPYIFSSQNKKVNDQGKVESPDFLNSVSFNNRSPNISSLTPRKAKNKENTALRKAELKLDNISSSLTKENDNEYCFASNSNNVFLDSLMDTKIPKNCTRSSTQRVFTPYVSSAQDYKLGVQGKATSQNVFNNRTLNISVPTPRSLKKRTPKPDN